MEATCGSSVGVVMIVTVLCLTIGPSGSAASGSDGGFGGGTANTNQYKAELAGYFGFIRHSPVFILRHTPLRFDYLQVRVVVQTNIIEKH